MKEIIQEIVNLYYLKFFYTNLVAFVKRKWIKRCSETGKILETRTEPFKNIRKEKKKGKKETSNIKSSIKKGITSQVKNIRKKNIKCISKKKPKNTDNKKLVSTKKV